MCSGSASINWYENGWKASKDFVTQAINDISKSVELPQVGVILFSYDAKLVSGLTTDIDAALDAVDDMEWPSYNSDTAGALAMAKQEIASGGRPDVPVIAILLTDGNPNDSAATLLAAGTRRPRSCRHSRSSTALKSPIH